MLAARRSEGGYPTGDQAVKNCSVEQDHAADAVLLLHQLGAAVDLVEGQPMAEKGLDVELAGEPAIDDCGTCVRPFTPPNESRSPGDR